MTILRFRCTTYEEFLQHYLANLSHGGLFCATTAPLAPGSDVVVEIVCKRLPNHVLIRGQVVSWRPALPRKRIRAGATVEFLADEVTKRDFVIETLKSDGPHPPRRRHMRLPVGVPVQVSVADRGRQPAVLREISVSGALLTGMAQPSQGTELVVDLALPGSVVPLPIAGRVLYHAGADGTGVRFHFREGGGSRRLRELVRRLRAS